MSLAAKTAGVKKASVTEDLAKQFRSTRVLGVTRIYVVAVYALQYCTCYRAHPKYTSISEHGMCAQDPCCYCVAPSKTPRQSLILPSSTMLRSAASRFSCRMVRQPPVRTSQAARIGKFSIRSFSSEHQQGPPVVDSSNFVGKPPSQLTPEMAEGISDATKFYIKYGISHQRLEALQQSDVPTVTKWQHMMEIFLATQVHVIAGLGYTPNEEGLSKYAHDLASCLQTLDPTLQEVLVDTRRETWRQLVATAFGLDPSDIPVFDIVKAREVMHRVSSKMMAPETLLEIQTRTSIISGKSRSNYIARGQICLLTSFFLPVFHSKSSQTATLKRS